MLPALAVPALIAAGVPARRSNPVVAVGRGWVG